MATEATAIVLDFDGGDMTATCLDSLLQQSRVFARIIALDNGSGDPLTGRLPPSLLEKIELFRVDENLGFTGGINYAMKLVQTPLVAWINNDVTLDARWLEVVAATMESSDNVAASQSVILDSGGLVDGAGIDIVNGTFQQSRHGAPGVVTERAEDRARATRPYIGVPEEIWSVSGTAALFVADNLRACGLSGDVLHPAFFAYYEDVELGARFRAAGLRSLLVNEPLAVHRGSQSRARLGRLALRFSVRNRYMVKRLHPSVGSWYALLAEDVRRLLILLMRGRVRDTVTLVMATFEGLIHPIRWRDEQ